MLKTGDFRTLALRPEREENTILTVYLDVDQSQQANLNRGFERQLKNMLTSLRDNIRDDRERKAFAMASGRAEDFVARYHVGARGLAIVSDASDGYFWGEETDFPIRSQIRWGREAFVGPLAVAADEYERVDIVLLDRSNLRLFSMFLGEVEEHIQEGSSHRKVRHIKTVGMDHLGSASHVQRKADRQIRLNLRYIAKDMDLMLEQHGVRRIILAGSPEITAELRSVLPNLSIMSLSRYKQFVETLDTRKGHEDDKRRKERRKRLLLLPRYEEKEFTPRDLTQTSQLVRLGAQAIMRVFADTDKPPVVVSLPGSVTGTVRKSWKVLGCLSLASPQVLDENGDMRTKTEIRDITHLHHALDACVLALASHFIPNNGRVWELIVKRNLNDAEKQELMKLKVFGFNAENRFELRDLDNRLKEQIRQRLAEKRVVQHIPARMDGLRVEQNTWRVVAVKEDEVILRQRIRQPDGSRPEKVAQEKPGKLLGLKPLTGRGKLAKNKGVLVIPDNFGVALDPQPTIIPFHKVWSRLQELLAGNGGKRLRVLRNGQLVRVPGGKNFKGVWRVFSAKNNSSGMALDIGAPDVVRLKNKTEGHKINVRLATLIKDGMEVIKVPLTGIAVCPTTSSA